MKKRILAWLLVLVMALSLAACSAPAADNSDQPSDSPAPTGSVSPAVEADLSQSILEFASAELAAAEQALTVNGKPVSNTLFGYMLALSCSYFENAYYYYGYTIADYAGYILNDACSMAVYYELMEQKATELGCPLTDEQLAAIDEAFKSDMEEDPARLTMFGLTEEDMRFIYAMESVYENVQGVIVPNVTEEDLNDYVYHVKHILISTVDENRTPLEGDALEEKTALANNILAQLQACATQEELETLFDKLMNEHSEDGRDAEGNLGAPDGYTAVPGDMVAEFEKASLELEIGGLSGLVKSTFGYHIILRGEVENIEDYTDKCLAYKMDSVTGQWMSEADVVVDKAVEGINVADFYEHYVAWQNAWRAENPVLEEK